MTRHFPYDERWNGASIDLEHWHFHKQLYERYGIIMGPGDFSHMKNGLRKGKALFIREIARHRAIYRWRIKSTGEIIFVVAHRDRVFTAYPPRRELRERGRLLDAQRQASRAIELASAETDSVEPAP